MIWLDYDTEKFIKKTYNDERLLCSHLRHVPQNSRYIQIRIPIIRVNQIHYEINRQCVALHFEGDYEDKYGELVEFLEEQTDMNPQYEWKSNYLAHYQCNYIGEWNENNHHKVIIDFIAHFDELISAFYNNKEGIGEMLILRSDNRLACDVADCVVVRHLSLKDILSHELAIPDYQRNYCWNKDNVKLLLDDLLEHCEDGADSSYRLGCIILHDHDGVYDIIDGQQRLVTLAILCSELGVKCNLLKQTFGSTESISHIAYNKGLIRNFCKKISGTRHSFAQRLLSQIEFSVLILRNTSLDLAYTFFSHQNSRGVGLTDYDLLKAHHLRYIPSSFEKQAYQAAGMWDYMIRKGQTEETDETKYAGIANTHTTVLDIYLFNLRKWMRMETGGDDGKIRRIKKEYEAAPIIADIPPFGEKFYFNEPIQGGTHFFEWVNRHIKAYQTFSKLEELRELRFHFRTGSEKIYRNVIEAILFGYYLKFGEQYLTEALLAIMRIIAEHRYNTKKTSAKSIFEYVSRSGVIQMIDRATSPTFVLAECRDKSRSMVYPPRKEMRPIQKIMRGKAAAISQNISTKLIVASFNNLNK